MRWRTARNHKVRRQRRALGWYYWFNRNWTLKPDRIAPAHVGPSVFRGSSAPFMLDLSTGLTPDMPAVAPSKER